MKTLVALLITAGSITAVQAQDILKEMNSRSFQLGSCMLILNQDKMISNKNLGTWQTVAREMKTDPKAIRHYEGLWDGLNNRNAKLMFEMSVNSCAKLGHKVL
jgi:hypothetical protein